MRDPDPGTAPLASLGERRICSDPLCPCGLPVAWTIVPPAPLALRPPAR